MSSLLQTRKRHDDRVLVGDLQHPSKFIPKLFSSTKIHSSTPDAQSGVADFTAIPIADSSDIGIACRTKGKFHPVASGQCTTVMSEVHITVEIKSSLWYPR
jgi:hypothetical protein